jgi:hypothetical protein
VWRLYNTCNVQVSPTGFHRLLCRSAAARRDQFEPVHGSCAMKAARQAGSRPNSHTVAPGERPTTLRARTPVLDIHRAKSTRHPAVVCAPPPTFAHFQHASGGS